MSRFHQGHYQPINPDKYVGKYPITFRSSWELTFCRKCDTHPNILQWASEPIRISYRNPHTDKYTIYIPDFLITYNDKNSVRHVELIEIKPLKQTLASSAKTAYDKAALVLNAAKWQAAQIWANENGMKFRVITEDNMFNSPKK